MRSDALDGAPSIRSGVSMYQVDDNAELRRLHEAGLGLIYNDFSGKGSGAGNVLHTANCRWVLRSKVSVRKFYFCDIVEAREWLLGQRGPEGISWKACATCRPGLGGERGGIRDLPASRQTSDRRPAAERPLPFSEGLVEDALAPWFESRGFSVRKRVRVQNGIVDLVATNEDETWVIEAKGEDRGGYTSAMLNFQVGVGQIVSRMGPSSPSRFGLAVPLTPDFIRVLKNFVQTTGFEQLNLWLFVARRTGDIDQIAPSDVGKYIKDLAG